MAESLGNTRALRPAQIANADAPNAEPRPTLRCELGLAIIPGPRSIKSAVVRMWVCVWVASSPGLLAAQASGFVESLGMCVPSMVDQGSRACGPAPPLKPTPLREPLACPPARQWTPERHVALPWSGNVWKRQRCAYGQAHEITALPVCLGGYPLGERLGKTVQGSAEWPWPEGRWGSAGP